MRMMNDILTLILGGGRGTRLFPLTRVRAKPAVPIGGKYRLIDVALSNCVHSGCYRVFVLTQFMSVSLNRHINSAFAFDRLRRGFVDIIPASQTQSSDDWFQGTADAVRKSMLHFRQHSFRDYLILSGDHLYRMDYAKLWEAHKQNDADVTIATIPVKADRLREFGIMQTDVHGRITGFVEKPKKPDLVADYSVPWREGGEDDRRWLASMGIYLFRREVLEKLLSETDKNDFGYNIVPMAIQTTRTFAYRFDGYWEDVGKIEDFFRANIQLTDPNPVFSFYDPHRPIFTRPRTLPGSILENAEVRNSIITDGCLIKDARITRSIVGIRSLIGRGSELEETLVMGADFFEGEEYYPDSHNRHLPNIGIGSGCSIKRAIIDKNARIGDNVIISPKAEGTNLDGDGYIVRNGITVVEKNSVIAPGTVI